MRICGDGDGDDVCGDGDGDDDYINYINNSPAATTHSSSPAADPGRHRATAAILEGGESGARI